VKLVGPVISDEYASGQTLGMRLPVFFPYQLQGQMTMLLELLMNGIPALQVARSLALIRKRPA